MDVQHLAIDHGEWVCRGCRQPIEDLGDEGPGINHRPDCTELAKLRA